jgi:predicted metalloprotease with PDZ domain
VSIDGQAITGAAVLREIVGRHSPGDTVQVRFEQRGRTRTVTVTLTVNPQLEVVRYEEAGLELTEEMREFRRRWLGEN